MASTLSDGYCFGIEASINPMVTKTCKMAWLVPDKKGLKFRRDQIRSQLYWAI